MGNTQQNPLFKLIGDELKKAAVNYQQQQQNPQQPQPLVSNIPAPTAKRPTSKKVVRNKNQIESAKLKYAEGLMKLQLFLLALFLGIAWMVLLLN